MELNVCCYCPDLATASPDKVLQKIEILCEDHDIIVLPEYLLEVIPLKIQGKIDKLIIFGSKIEDNQNKLQVSIDQEIKKISKLKLTPWENNLIEGSSLETFEFLGSRITIMICFDVEFPDLAQKLKQENIDLLLIPAATESAEGYMRVSRCASARAIELGCAVVTCHLVGKSSNELVDINVGNHNLFLPAQTLFAEHDHSIADLKFDGEVLKSFTIPLEQIRSQRTLHEETNPALKN